MSQWQCGAEIVGVSDVIVAVRNSGSCRGIALRGKIM
jgi:hypothetical protein